MRKFKRQHAMRLQHQLQAFDEIVEVGHLRQDVVSKNQVGGASVGDELFGYFSSEKLDQSWHALRHCHFRDIGRRLNAKDRHVLLDEILQQISVIAGDFDHEAVLVQ